LENEEAREPRWRIHFGILNFRYQITSCFPHLVTFCYRPLRGIEENTTARRSRPLVSRPMARVNDSQVCKGYHSTGHHYTECLNYPYMWDSDANARLLEPGKRLSGPADWQDIHCASLHHLICTALQYYISLHHTHIQDIHTLLMELELNSQFGDITAFDTSVLQANLLPTNLQKQHLLPWNVSQNQHLGRYRLYLILPPQNHNLLDSF
jgi:hypothetical protein